MWVDYDRSPTGKLPVSSRSRPGDAPGTLDLNKLFVEPRHIRGGVGRALLARAVAEAASGAWLRCSSSPRRSTASVTG
jgi:GNAT superfamily N-acetyltransferase